MSFLCKGLLGISGLFFAGLPGAVFGLIVGHALDLAIDQRIAERRHKLEQEGALRLVYEDALEGLFLLAGKLSSADGAQNEIEQTEARRILTGVRTSSTTKATIFGAFINADAHLLSYYQVLMKLADLYSMTPRLAHVLPPQFCTEMLVAIGRSDGPLAESELRLLDAAADVLKTGPIRSEDTGGRRFASVSEIQGPTLADCYETLGCRAEDDLDTIKKNYRKLLTEYHPDKVAAKELPQGFMEFANQRVIEIKQAYEEVVKARLAP